MDNTEAKRERFCRLVAMGMHRTDAHEKAGYSRHRGNALELERECAERIAQLQEESFVPSGPEGLDEWLLMLARNATKATQEKQYNAVNRAYELMAKALGYLNEAVVVREAVDPTALVERLQAVNPALGEMVADMLGQTKPN